jgi:hypothetical protein
MKIINTLLIISVFSLICFAQDKKWTQINFENNLFSASLPPEQVIDTEKIKDSKRQLKVWAFADGFAATVTSYKADKPKDFLKNLRVGAKGSDQTEIGDVYARKFIFGDGDSYSAQVYLATKKSIYYFSFSATQANSTIVDRFLNSLKTQGKVLFPAEKSSSAEAENTIAEIDLKTSSEVLTALNRVPNNLKANYEIDRVTRSMNKVQKGSILTRYPIILRDADPKSGKIKGQMVVVRIQLLANGDTGEVAVFSDADDKAIFAAVESMRSMKFLPAQLNGKNVDSYYVLLFNGEVGDGSSGIIQ